MGSGAPIKDACREAVTTGFRRVGVRVGVTDTRAWRERFIVIRFSKEFW